MYVTSNLLYMYSEADWHCGMARWLTETLETLMKERVVDEQKAEHNKLKVSAYKVSVSRDLLVYQNNIYW
jgi:hypothetical protein